MASCARHDLVWLAEQGWQQALDDAPVVLQPALQRWRERRLPAIVRRQDADASASDICLGIALPPQGGHKQRIGLRVALANIVATCPPPAVEAMMAVAPADWQAPLAEFHASAAAAGISFRAYGSAALQYLTGEQYVTPASDIDLLFQPRTRGQLAAGVALLSSYSTRLPLDGEIVFPSGQAVAWKEWAGALNATGAPRVLVKARDAVRLMKTDELLATLDDCT
jgi:phosphoribosyl-dephospho-CoA transferase